jgi:MoaA/NifB/PqqE/SkfB family radical SAM enzyme
MSDNIEIKESAAQEVRNWVRLTKACNNRCLFCLDRESQDGTNVPTDEIRRKIIEGREQGATRLILSGGEATIHPEFIKFIALGKEVGYSWIQTITNGRVFSYKKYAALSIKAGLNEATFSMHGHTPELHDMLVGVPKAFDQAMAGMHNLLGKIVVNVDVALNKQNVPHLREILDFFMALGIHEFDLLHTVPFGLAWTNRDLLFYDPQEYNHYLKKAFEVRHKPGIFMWTNRLPAHFLEGMEDLIQDPHKMHDEIRGRAEHFKEWVEAGTPLPCWGDRCEFCFLQGFCARLDHRVKKLRTENNSLPVKVRAEASRLFNGQSIWPENVALPKEISLELIADSPALVTPWLEQMGERLKSLELVISSMNYDPAAWADVMQHVTSVRLSNQAVQASASRVKQWLEDKLKRIEQGNPGPELLIPALKQMADVLDLDWLKLKGLAAGKAGIQLYIPSRELLTEAIELDMDLDEMKALSMATGWSVFRLPPCLIPGSDNRSDEDEIDLTLLDEDGKMDMVRYADDYIRRGYMVKSTRCESCALDNQCRGLQITGARRFGLGSLTPQEK